MPFSRAGIMPGGTNNASEIQWTIFYFHLPNLFDKRKGVNPSRKTMVNNCNNKTIN